MKLFHCILAAAVVLFQGLPPAFAGLRTVNIPQDGTPVDAEGRVVAVYSFQEGTTLYRIDEQYETDETVDETSSTNTTYYLTYTNAVGNVATNVTDYDLAPLPPGYQYVDYWTNAVVTYTYATNRTTYLSAAYTNLVAVAGTPIDASSSVYSAYVPAPTDGAPYQLIPAGTKLATDGTGGSVRVLIEN